MQRSSPGLLFYVRKVWSFSRIAAELDVSKPTLIMWSRPHQFDINSLRATKPKPCPSLSGDKPVAGQKRSKTVNPYPEVSLIRGVKSRMMSWQLRFELEQ